MPDIKVSVLMPSLNVAPFIRQCMDSVVGQTLKDIEIICIDAGSTDGTLEILREYAGNDPRITILNSDRKSYGYQMNLGIDAARGKYIGIVETDDYAELNMFESLYNAAEQDHLDVVKSGFFYYYSIPEERNIPAPITSCVFSKRVFCPLTDFLSPMEQAEFYNIKPTIWSAIYSLDFLRINGIRFNETPGASFQDASFNFKVFALAGKMRLVEDCFLHYRQDNENSSINSPGKVYCVVDEYHEIESFLASHPGMNGSLAGVKSRLKYDSYIWNYNRLSEPLQKEFIEFASRDFAEELASGYCEKKYFPWYKWKMMHWIVDKPDEFHAYMQAQKVGQTLQTTKKPAQSKSRKVINKIKRVWRAFRRSVRVFGMRVTLKKASRKIGRVLKR